MFVITLPVNIEHVNYGNHLAHDKLVSLMHEARLRFFDELEQSEIDFYGVSLILKSMTVNYRQEAFRGDQLQFALTINEVRGSAFSLHYVITKDKGGVIADADIVLVGFDYAARKIARLPDVCRQALTEQNSRTQS